MHRIISLLPGRQVALRVAAFVLLDLEIVVVADVARGAGYIRVAIGQREIDRWGSVVEVRSVERSSQPTIRIVAILASRREVAGDVVGTGCLLKILQVTRDTSGRQPQKLANGRALVALLAGHCRMGAEKRETILVILDLLDRDIPAQNGVTLRAVRSHPALVDVRMTILTVLAHVGKNRLHVALVALNLLVHPAQRIIGLVVIEFRYRTNGLPTSSGMTVFARNRERTVRTTAGLPLRRISGSSDWLTETQNQPECDLEYP